MLLLPNHRPSFNAMSKMQDLDMCRMLQSRNQDQNSGFDGLFSTIKD
jgi:hypothetical protein